MPFRIRTKLVIAFLAIIIPFMVITGIVSLYNMRIIYKGVNKVEAVAEEMHKSHNLQLALDTALMPINDYIITGDKRYMEDFRKTSVEVERWLKELEGELSGLEGMFPAEVKEEREILKEVRASWQKVKEMSLEIFAIPNPVGNTDAARLMEEMDYKWAYPAIEKLRRWQEIDKEEYREAHEESERALKLAVIVMIAGGVILFSLGGFFAVFYSRIFVRPIETIHERADAIAAGNFKTRLDIKTGDEIEQLANAMNEMAVQLDSLYSNLQGMVAERTKELQESEELLRIQISRMPIGYIVWDTGFRVVSWNPAAERIFGFTSEEAKGKHPYDLIVPKEAQPHVDIIWHRLLEGDTAAHSINENLTKDGRTIICEWANTPLRYHNGDVIGVLSMVQDITERKKAEEQLRLHGEIERNMAEAVYLIRVSDGVIVYTNPFFDRLFGYEPGEMVGKHVSIVNSPGDKSAEAVANEIISCLMRTGVWNGEVHNIRKDGTTFWSHANVFTFEHHQYGRVWLSMHQDITERKEAAAKIEEQLDFLKRFEKVAIGREFRIKELRDENDLLKKRIEAMEKRRG